MDISEAKSARESLERDILATLSQTDDRARQGNLHRMNDAMGRSLDDLRYLLAMMGRDVPGSHAASHDEVKR